MVQFRTYLILCFMIHREYTDIDDLGEMTQRDGAVYGIWIILVNTNNNLSSSRRKYTQ